MFDASNMMNKYFGKVANGMVRLSMNGDMAIKKSNENPLMDVFYNGYFKGKAHELLHNHE